MSDYINPKAVKTPKNRLSGKNEVLVDKGERGWSICRLTWDGQPALGIRWNGSFNDDNMGTPQSRGMPTWFILPNEVAAVVQKAVDAGDFDDPEEEEKD